MRSACKLCATLLLLLLPTVAAWANSPGGGTGTGANVTLVNNGNGTVTISNGIVSILCTTAGATINQINYTYNNGSGTTTNQLLSGGKDGGMLYWEFGGFGTGTFNYSVSADPTTNSGNYAEIDLVSNWSGNTATTAGDAEVHFSMLRGSPGFYVTLTLGHRNTYPAASIGEVRTNIYTAPYFNWMSVDAARDKQYNNGATAVPVFGAPQEVTLWTSGFANGVYEDKYKYSANFGTERVWGWSSVSNTTAGFTGKNIGIWNILASAEYYNGGPMKPELMDAPMVNMFNGGHYFLGTDSSWAANEAWTKVYGPYFVYINNISNTISDPIQASRALYADAKAQGAAELTAWPYSWFVNANYTPAASRGTITGQLVISDPDNPNASAANLWVGAVQKPSSTTNITDFQQWAKPYQFWVKSDANGNFNISNVIAGGNYTLFAFGPGAAGTFESQSLGGNTGVIMTLPATPFSVNVTGGVTTNLGTVTWSPPRVGPSVFEIGYPDREGDKFRHGDDWWIGDLGPSTSLPSPIWTKFLEYPFDFPNGPNYIVGQSRWNTDWNFIQPVVTDSQGNYDGSTSTITFNLASTPAAGSQASLYLALASDYAGPLIVTVNNTNLSSPTSGYFPYYSISDTSIREGINGAFSDSRLNFAGNLLKQGTNTITINMRKGGYFANHAMYDYIRLELTGYVPPPPASVTAFAGNNSMLLSWPTTPGATSYNVLRSTTSGSGFASVANNITGPVCGSGPANATYVDNTAANGVTYYYVVQSANPLGTSSNSTQSAGLAPSTSGPASAPATPTGLVATAGKGSVTLNWDTASDTNFYTIQRSTVVNDVGTVSYITLSNTVTGSTYTDTSPTNGSTYLYQIFATNAVGTSSNSASASATPQPSAPSAAPTNVTVNAGSGQSTLNWTAVPGAVGYVIERATSLGGPYTYVMSVTETTYADTGLGNNTHYYYTVNAVNTGGASGNSTIVNDTTPPAAPTGLTATPGNAQVTLNWSAPSGAASYVVQRATVTGGPYTTVMSGVIATTYTDTGRTNGTTYYYVVAATGTGGTGVNSAEASATPTGTASPGLTWTGSSSSAWDTTTTNWISSGSATTYADGSKVAFNDGPANTTISISATVSPNSLTFNNSASNYTISGASISGTASILMTGSNTTTLSSANAFSGGTTINAGTIKLTGNNGNVNFTTALGTGIVTINGGMLQLAPPGGSAGKTSSTFSNNFMLNGGILYGNDGQEHIQGTITVSATTTLLRQWNNETADQTKALLLDGVLSGSAALNLYGTGGYTNQGARIWIDNANNTYSGSVTVYAGTALSGFSAPAGGFSLGLGSNTALQFATINLQGTQTAGASDATELSGLQFLSGVTVPVIGALSGNGNISLDTLGSGATAVVLTVGGSNDSTTFTGILSGNGGLTKTGTGTLILSGANTYTGNTTVTAGTLQINGAINNSANVTVDNNATLVVNGQLATGTLTVNAGGLVAGNSGNITASATITNNGNMTVSSGGTFPLNSNVANNGAMLVNNGTQLAVSGSFVNNGVLDIITGAQTLPTNFVNNGVVLDTSSVKVAGLSYTSGVMQLSIQSYVGHNYQLQRSDTLTPPTWTNVGTAQTGTGSPLNFSDSSGLNNNIGFYRIMVSP